MIAFNSTYFYLTVCYAHMKIFLLFMRNISFTFIIIIIIIIIIVIIIIIIIIKTAKSLSFTNSMFARLAAG